MPHTTFIVGAGASTDFDFPTGPKLQRDIIDLIKIDENREDSIDPRIMTVLSEFDRRNTSYSQLIDLCRWMSNALPLAPSIDSFLDTQSDGDDAISFLGKYCISLLISEGERQSPLAAQPRVPIDYEKLSQSWLGKFWLKANRGGSVKSVERHISDFSFITFNYDRCIEQFLFLALIQYYRLDHKSAYEIIQQLDIVHVYGSLGTIGGTDDDTKFGVIRNCFEIVPIAKRIRTFSEQVDSRTKAQVAQILQHTERLIILGFSFAQINRSFLEEANSDSQRRKQVHGTSFGMSFFDKTAAEEWCDRCFRQDNSGSQLENSMAPDFFDAHQLLF